VTTRIEDGVVVFLLDRVEKQCPVELSFSVGVLFEPTGGFGLEVGLIALGIKWRTAALGRCEGNLRAPILERRSKARRAPRAKSQFYARYCRASRERSEPSGLSLCAPLLGRVLPVHEHFEPNALSSFVLRKTMRQSGLGILAVTIHHFIRQP